jgi:pimeloyl-ACP methyl ester carboxylesterase
MNIHRAFLSGTARLIGKSLTSFDRLRTIVGKRLSWASFSMMVLLISPTHAQIHDNLRLIAPLPVEMPKLMGKEADLPGVKLWYTDTGGETSKEVLILLHPNTGNSEVWAQQSEAFSKAGYRVIAFDRRGWGRSVAKTPVDNGAQSIAQDLEALTQSLKIERFHLLGIAGGGFAAVDYAAWKPERIKSLIVGASTAQLSEPSMKEVVDRIEIPGIRKMASHYREVGPSYRARDPEGTRAWIEIEERSQQPQAKSQALRTPNTFEKIKTIKSPTLIIAGGADLLAPPALMRMWVQYLDHAQWVLIPEAGHALSWEEPELFNQAVLAFLKNH